MSMTRPGDAGRVERRRYLGGTGRGTEGWVVGASVPDTVKLPRRERVSLDEPDQ